jgi:hypothetical protein
MNVQGIDPREKLMDMPLREDGSAVERQGQSRANFMDELKAKCMANAVTAFLKGFPGFAEWWFGMDELRRDNIHVGIQIVILNAMNRVSGLPEQKVASIRNEILTFFDQLPSFTQWQQIVLGSTLRNRVKHQLDAYLLEELKRV